MKRLGVLNSSLDGMPVHRRATPSINVIRPLTRIGGESRGAGGGVILNYSQTGVQIRILVPLVVSLNLYRALLHVKLFDLMPSGEFS